MKRILYQGLNGLDVILLQKKLNEFGAGLEADGWFGVKTLSAVKKFQAANGLWIDGIVGAKTYKALGMVKEQGPDYLVIHVSATPEKTSGFTAESIKNYHLSLGWGRPGYSRIIEYDGKVVETWSVDTSDGIQPFEMTYGTGNRQVDLNAVNICIIGGLDAKTLQPKDTRTTEQEESLQKLVKEMVAKHPAIKIAGHNQFFNKACPCFFVPSWLESIGIAKENIYQDDPFGYTNVYPKVKPKNK